MSIKRFFYFSLVLLLFGSCTSNNQKNQSVNKVIGDVSFKNEAEGDIEFNRVKNHLNYVYDLLISKEVHLSEELFSNRQKMLALLREYIDDGFFPKNFVYQGERRPCFMDMNNNVCAVGHLVEKTEGFDLLYAINERHQHDYIEEMDLPELLAWVDKSGLTPEELAMIQPTYGWVDPIYEEPDYTHRLSYSTMGMVALNSSMSALNVSSMNNPQSKILLPSLSIATGLTQSIVGFVNLEKNSELNNKASRQTHRSLCYANVGVGLLTSFLGVYKLGRRQNLNNNISYNIQSYPIDHSTMALGFSLSKKF